MLDCLGNSSALEYPMLAEISFNFSLTSLAAIGLTKNINKWRPPLFDRQGTMGSLSFLMEDIILL